MSRIALLALLILSCGSLRVSSPDIERILTAYVTAFGRHPSDEEEQSAEAFLQSQANVHGEAKPGEKSWADLCHVLFNVKEFIFLN